MLGAVTAHAATSPIDTIAAGFEDPPLVFEFIRAAYRYEVDGTGQTVISMRARPLNEAGVQALGQILFPYLEGRSTLVLRRFQVTKPDGSVLPVDEDKVQRLPAPVAAAFPVYSDIHLLHVIAPALAPGDILDYEIAVNLTQPDTPGHFGLAYNFERSAPVVTQILEIDVPSASAIRLHTRADLQPTLVDAQDRRTYRWERANSSPTTPEADNEDEEPELDVELSSFDSWEDVGAWYLDLVEDRTLPNPEIRGLAKELTAGISGDLERLKAIYRHVARDYRYLGLSLGLARYRPQKPSEVVSNGYGDCKDKHTLLASLLEAEGFKAYPVLISRSRDVNPSVPAPHQFDHMISSVEIAGETLWLDATSQVAPFGYLTSDLRGKQSLVIGRNGTSVLEETPDSLPFPSIARMQLEGEVSEDGELTAKVTYRTRGDGEFFARSMLFAGGPAVRMPFAESFLEQALSRRMEIDDFSYGDLTDTAEPLELRFAVRMPGYVKMLTATQELSHYMKVHALPAVDESAPSLDLGHTYQTKTSFKVRLPEGFEARPPARSALASSFGSYTTDYSVGDGFIQAQRNISIMESSIPKQQYREYAAFRASLAADDVQKFRLRQTPEARASRAVGADTEQLLTEGRRALTENNYDEAISLLSQVVELESDHPTAWFRLGQALVNADRFEEGVAAFTRQTEIDPYYEGAFGNLGWALEQAKDPKAAEAAFRRQLEVYPLDRYANSRLGAVLEDQGRCEEALVPLESAISLEETDTRSKTYLGSCLLELGRIERAESVLSELRKESRVGWELNYAGTAAHDANQLELALGLLTRATEVEPDHEDAHNELGRVLIRLERYEEALVPLRRQIEIDSEHLYAFNNLGLALNRLGRQQEALPHLRRQIEINADDPWAHYNLALALEALGETAAAIEAHRDNLRVNPMAFQSLAALALLAPASADLGALIEQAQESDGDGIVVRQIELARLVGGNRCAEAIDLLHEMLLEDPQSAAAYATLAHCYSMLAQSDQALEAGLKALALLPNDAHVNILVGMAYLQKGLYAEAIPYLEASKRLAPGQFEAQDVLDFARSQVEN